MSALSQDDIIQIFTEAATPAFWQVGAKQWAEYRRYRDLAFELVAGGHPDGSREMMALAETCHRSALAHCGRYYAARIAVRGKISLATLASLPLDGIDWGEIDPKHAASACDAALAELIRLTAPEIQQSLEQKPRTTKKRSTERGEGRIKLIAALIAHHKYANGSCLNPAPIGNNELAKAAVVSTSTASTFFNEEFEGHTKYKAICRDIGQLVNSLKLLSGEFSPHDLYGSEPPEKRRDGRRSRRSRQESNDD
jgi:hypothetical protein